MKIAALARQARESLGRGLEALQAGDAPERLLTVAQPLAKAMGTLVEMEAASPEPARKAADAVLAALREALGLLQQPQNAQLPAVESAMSSVAEALGYVHQMTESPAGAARGVKPKTQFAATQLDSPPQPAPASAARHAGSAPSPVTAAAAGLPPVNAAKPAGLPPVSAVKPAASAAKPGAAPAAAKPVVKASEPAAPAVAPAAATDAPLRAVEAALGAHSATNFYKGLAGGDIVASGGLFVATYQAPDVGQPLLLKVTMPGGYAFEAKGVVAWRRDVQPSATGSGETPGFGAQFSEISDEGRGLIQRYVRNREPLFHDDA
jgi:Tfp pilus assembly protein PilZ